MKEKKIKTCIECGKQFNRTKDLINRNISKQCSKECLWKTNIKESHIKYNNSNTYIWVECEICTFRGGDLGTHYKKCHNRSSSEFKNVKSQKMIDAVKGDKNPGYQHGGTLSPFSSKSLYHSEEQIKLNKAKAAKSIKENGNCQTSLAYWLKQTNGNEELAKELQSKRQTTFSLEICIEKYGEIEGREIWNKRQEKWLDSISQTIPASSRGNTRVSKAEKEIYKELIKKIDVKSQFRIVNSRYLYDLCFNDKIIEYNGTYWHCAPEKYNEDFFHQIKKLTAKEIWEYDKQKIKFAEDNGYKVMILTEKNYHLNKEKSIQECYNFLME